MSNNKEDRQKEMMRKIWCDLKRLLFWCCIYFDTNLSGNSYVKRNTDTIRNAYLTVCSIVIQCISFKVMRNEFHDWGYVAFIRWPLTMGKSL